MKIEKILKRFLKENGIYGSKESKDIIIFFNEFDEVFIPFNAFRWDTTKQGHNYWYSLELNWFLYLYSNINLIDDEEKKEMEMCYLVDKLFDLINYYCADERDCSHINGYNEAQKLYDELKVKI